MNTIIDFLGSFAWLIIPILFGIVGLGVYSWYRELPKWPTESSKKWEKMVLFKLRDIVYPVLDRDMEERNHDLPSQRLVDFNIFSRSE